MEEDNGITELKELATELLNLCPVGSWLLWPGSRKLSPPPPPLAELSREGIFPVISDTELKAVGIMKPATLARFSLFRDKSVSHCDGQQDTVHCY